MKAGVGNKPQVPNETNTARPSLWSNLKNKSGLQTLSTLFVAVLEKRQSCGRLTAPSTFKPPPRVTLTDTKREGWLRDLANPAIALRRLSRTIPHGIRGKLLLEQCLSKNIPTARAVWLAKCVGSNEMRAFKRKGANGTVGIGGELKWIREWTVFVEQFVESTISACGQQDWKARMDYACVQCCPLIFVASSNLFVAFDSLHTFIPTTFLTKTITLIGYSHRLTRVHWSVCLFGCFLSKYTGRISLLLDVVAGV